jgi:hypothetical protein
MQQQSTEPDQQQACHNNEQNRINNRDAAKPTESDQQQTCCNNEHDRINSQQTCHSYWNNQQTCRNKLDADQNDVSSQFHYAEPLSTFWVQTVTIGWSTGVRLRMTTPRLTRLHEMLQQQQNLINNRHVVTTNRTGSTTEIQQNQQNRQ